MENHLFHAVIAPLSQPSGGVKGAQWRLPSPSLLIWLIIPSTAQKCLNRRVCLDPVNAQYLTTDTWMAQFYHSLEMLTFPNVF